MPDPEKVNLFSFYWLSLRLSFMLSQVALVLVFREPLTWPQWSGIALITAGIFVASLCK